MADVARVAGVSLMTVSRVVNGGIKVAEATRTKVEKAIAAVGYVPNLAARSLAGQGLCSIALLYDNPSSAFLAELLMGSLAAARSANVQLLVEPFDRAEPLSSLVERLERHKVNGVLLPGLLCDDPALVAGLVSARLFVARIAASVGLPGAIAVGIDDQAAAHAMTRYLLQLGHRRIGLIGGARDYAVSGKRAEGYRAALLEAGIAPESRWVRVGDFSFRSGLDAAMALLEPADRPTAIFACNDDMAAGAIAAAHRLGLDVPRDLTVCGFDDTSMARSVWPSLTTVRQPVASMAEQALHQLVAAIASHRDGNPPVTRDLQLGFEIVHRDSTAPPAA